MGVAWVTDVVVLLGMVASGGALAIIWGSSNEWLLRRLAFVKRHDRYLGIGQFSLVIGLCLLLEAGLFWRLDVPVDIAVLGLGLSAYLPATFFFYCNVFHVGIRRELMWSCFFVLCCLGSIQVFQWLRLELIVPACVAFTALLCHASWRDPYCSYRRGLRLLDDLDRPAAAVESLAAARSRAPDDLRYAYHLGRAMIRNGDREEGEALIGEVLGREPDFVEQLERDPLRREEWTLMSLG